MNSAIARMCTRALLLLAVLGMAGCASYYQPRYGTDGVYYDDHYGYGSTVAVRSTAVVNPIYYPYWSIDYFYYSRYYHPYSVVYFHDPFFAPYPGWYYGYRPAPRFRTSFSFGYGGWYPWYGWGYHYHYYRPWYATRHYHHHYHYHARPAVDQRTAHLQQRGERRRPVPRETDPGFSRDRRLTGSDRGRDTLLRTQQRHVEESFGRTPLLAMQREQPVRESLRGPAQRMPLPGDPTPATMRGQRGSVLAPADQRRPAAPRPVAGQRQAPPRSSPPATRESAPSRTGTRPVPPPATRPQSRPAPSAPRTRPVREPRQFQAPAAGPRQDVPPRARPLPPSQPSALPRTPAPRQPVTIPPPARPAAPPSRSQPSEPPSRPAPRTRPEPPSSPDTRSRSRPQPR